MDIGTTVLISVTSLIVIGIGAYIAYVVGKKHNSSEDWMVGGRSLPVYVVGFSQAATAVGGGVLVAHAHKKHVGVVTHHVRADLAQLRCHPRGVVMIVLEARHVIF